MTTSPLPVIRAWRPFVRRISMWQETLGSSNTAVLARRDALREELAGAPSLACDIVGVLLTLALVANSTSSITAAAIALVATCCVWLLPGHRWYLAPLRVVAGLIAAFALSELIPRPLEDRFAVANVRPPMDALPLPVGLVLAIIGLVLIAVGARRLAARAPALPTWGAMLTGASVVLALGAGAYRYHDDVGERLRLHEVHARHIVELRNAPRSSILAVEDALANRNVTFEVARILGDLEYAFPNDPKIVSLRRSVDGLADARDRAAAAEETRAARAQAYVEHLQDVVFNRCVNECIAPGLACFNSGMSDDFCRANYKNIEQCRLMCAR